MDGTQGRSGGCTLGRRQRMGRHQRISHLRLALAQLAQLLLAQLQRGGQHVSAAAQLRALLLHARQLGLQVVDLVLRTGRTACQTAGALA